jgi:quercetin dioxygenase-like cupin family protein
MNDHLPPIRRGVTGDDAKGNLRNVAARPGYRAVNVWRTEQTPARITTGDTVSEHQGILPPRNGTILRIIDFPPEPQDEAELRRMLDQTFGGIYKDALHDRRPGKHPGMHRTETVDYAIVLEGEIWAVMDEGETLLRAGDVLIQRGTNHAWANRSDRTARIAFMLIDGTR